jgi:hypothetical protein
METSGSRWPEVDGKPEPTDLKSNRSARLPGGPMSLYEDGRASALCGYDGLHAAHFRGLADLLVVRPPYGRWPPTPKVGPLGAASERADVA